MPSCSLWRHCNDTWWCHDMETFCATVFRGVYRSPIDSSHKGRVFFVVSLKSWTSCRFASDLTCLYAHVMPLYWWRIPCVNTAEAFQTVWYRQYLSLCFKSPEGQLFVQQFANERSVLLTLSEWNKSVIGEFLLHWPVMWKTCPCYDVIFRRIPDVFE